MHEIQSPDTGKRYIIDGPASYAEACRDEAFGGDGLAMVRRFYEITAENAEQYRPDIIGHFDLIIKNNAGGRLFDEESRAVPAGGTGKSSPLSGYQCGV